MLKDIAHSILCMPYGYIDSDYSIYRSTVVRTVKEMVSKSVGVCPHRFTSCQSQELNRLRKVLLEFQCFFFAAVWEIGISSDVFLDIVKNAFNHGEEIFHSSLAKNYMSFPIKLVSC